MFLGKFIHTIDDGGRLTIPAKFRDGLSDGLVITYGFDHCLVVYPLREWTTLASKVSALPVTDREARAFRRYVFANASDTALDKQGRVLIPPPLREYIGVDGEVVITGLNTYIELWHPDEWHKEHERVEGDESQAWEKLEI
jgi:MraZ protein